MNSREVNAGLESKRQSEKSPWPRAIVIGFVLLALFNIALFVVAYRNRPGTVVDDPYGESLRAESTIAKRRVSSEINLKTVISVSPGSTPTSRLLLVSLSSGVPNDAWQQAKVSALRPADRSAPLEARLLQSSTDKAVWQAELPLTPGGIWLFEITAGLVDGREAQTSLSATVE